MSAFPKITMIAVIVLGAVGCSTTPKGDWVNFAAIDGGLSTNRALACSPDICGDTTAGRDAFRFEASAQDIADALSAIEPDAEFRTLPDGDIQARYVATTPVLHFRDDVDVLIHPVSLSESEVAVYSRSRVGLSDLGKNGARIDALEERLAKLLAENDEG